MIIGFFGKGGSGKTTTSTNFLRLIGPEYPAIFAIDADHNMDFSYNLGIEDPAQFVGTPAMTPDGIRLLASGPHTEEVFRGDVCSHSLFSPIKKHLAAAREHASQLVVVDNTAGMDSVGAGIAEYLDIAVVCVEPLVHSLKVGRQVVGGLHRFQKPILLVANKIHSEEQTHLVREQFPDLPIVYVSFQTPSLNSSFSEDLRAAFRELHESAIHAVTTRASAQT